MEKMPTIQQIETRKELYSVIENSIEYPSEAISDGLLVDLGNGYFAKVKVSICNAEKFDLEKVRTEYAEKLQKRAEKAEAARIKAEERAKKAAERAAKAAEKIM